MEHYNVEYLKDPEYQAIDKEYRQLLVDIKDEDKYSPKRRLMADRLDKLQLRKKRIALGGTHSIHESGGALALDSLPEYDGTFLYPPRIEHRLQPPSLINLDNDEYIAQPKLNGSNTSVTITPDKVIAKERHNTFFAVPPKFDFRSLYRGNGNMCICGEFMNKSKKGVDGLPFSGFVIWDITAYDGKVLLGTTPVERLELLDRLYPSGKPVIVNGLILFYHTDVPGIYKINSYLSQFYSVYQKIIGVDMVEGLVLKRKNSKLKPLTTETNNMQWAVKVRKPTKNYKFESGGGLQDYREELEHWLASSPIERMEYFEELVPREQFNESEMFQDGGGLKIGNDVKFMRGPHKGEEGRIKDVELRYKVKGSNGKIITAKEGEIFNQD